MKATQWQRTCHEPGTNFLTLQTDINDFNAYWSCDVKLRWCTDEQMTLQAMARHMIITVNDEYTMTCKTVSEAQRWFNGFSLGYSLGYNLGYNLGCYQVAQKALKTSP